MNNTELPETRRFPIEPLGEEADGVPSAGGVCQ